MSERVVATFNKEEEFLEDYMDVALAAAKIMNGEWVPNAFANDKARGNREYFINTGEEVPLGFDYASVHHNEDGFSYVQLLLKSSKRTVGIRIKKIDGELIAEKNSE